MATLLQPLIFLYLSLSIIHCDSYLSTLYTRKEESYLSNVILSSQDSESGLFEKSLSTTYYATEALTSLKEQIPKGDALCKSLKSRKISSWEDFHNLLLSRSRIPNCLDSIKDASKKKLMDGLSANKLSKIYYSVSGIYALSQSEFDLFDTSSIDLIGTFTQIQTFQLKNGLFSEFQKGTKSKLKSSIHKSSMALFAASKLLTMPNLSSKQLKSLQSEQMNEILSSFMSAAKALIGDYVELDDEMVSYSKSLTATSLVLESIHSFLSALPSLTSFGGFSAFSDRSFVTKLVSYILSFASTTSPTSARHVVTLMNMIKSSQFFLSSSMPICVTFKNQIFGDNESNDLQMTILNVFGDQILANNDGTNVYIKGSKEKKFEFSADSNAFFYEFDNDLPGLYAFDVLIDDDNFAQTLSIPCSVKVLTSIKSINFGIQYTKNQNGYNKVAYPQTFGDAVYDISPSQKVKIEIDIGAPSKASQIFVDFVDFETQLSVLQIAPKTRQEKYGLTVDVNKAVFDSLSEGKYFLNLVVADALYENGGIIWQNIVFLNCIEEEDEAEVDYEPINDEVPNWTPKKAINHTFGSNESATNSAKMMLFSMLFCAVVALPFLYFVYFIFASLKTSLSFEKEIAFSSLFFIGTLSGIVSILFFYWWQWNIFEAAGWLFMACVPAFFFGYNVLKQHLVNRTTKKVKQF